MIERFRVLAFVVESYIEEETKEGVEGGVPVNYEGLVAGWEGSSLEDGCRISGNGVLYVGRPKRAECLSQLESRQASWCVVVFSLWRMTLTWGKCVGQKMLLLEQFVATFVVMPPESVKTFRRQLS